MLFKRRKNQMKRIIIVLLAIALVFIFAFATAAIGPLFIDTKSCKQNLSVNFDNTPERIIFTPKGKAEGIELYFSRNLDVAENRYYAYCGEDDDLLYLFDSNIIFIGQISNPVFPITLRDEFEDALKDPEKQITEAEAVNIAYEHAAGVYGDYIREFDVKAISGDEYHWDIFLAREFHAKDFKVYGPSCVVTVMIDGSINLCTYGGNDELENVQNLIENIYMADLETFVHNQVNIRYGDEVVESEITGVKYLKENGANILRIDVKHILREPSDLSPERLEQWRTLGIKEEKNDYYDFPLER